jgi:Phosphatidylserine/phosphatidylglycerophosphate/cardiolipin synthases and related enzymes
MSGPILTAVAAVLLFSLLTAFGVYIYGRLAYRPGGEASHAMATQDDATELDRLIRPETASRGGQSGMLLCSDNLDAFALRALSARAAGRSLDLQYYYWKTDRTGMLLFREVIAAADRGVRVRLLLDDINLRGNDETYLALDRHPNIDVRVFNPCWNRVGALHRGFELIFRPYSSTRRMHNKAWIADGRLAIVGGRNIGDAYFDASDTMNFRDLDILAVGAAVQQAEAIFDRFWNSDCVFPLSALPGWGGNLEALRRQTEAAAAPEQAKPYLAQLEEEAEAGGLLPRLSQFHWTDQAEVVSDPPRKSKGHEADRWLRRAIFPVLLSARSRLEITSPYFIPGRRGVRQLKGVVRRGAQVAVLTNSLAATDVAAAHGAYARYRRALLRNGIELYELKPEARANQISLFGSGGASLHTKAFIVDDKAGFVGSFNFDPRSLSLNTEMGVLFQHAALAGEVSAVFDEQISPENSYRMELDHLRLVWNDGEGPRARRLHHEPNASLRRRVVARLAGFLPLESQL